MESEKTIKLQLERRNLISSTLLVVLIGVAFQEMISPMRDTLRTEGITLPTMLMFAIFLMTSIRFFIGNHLHLQSEDCASQKYQVWLFDLLVILMQITLIAFMGGVCSVEISRKAKIDFIDHMILLYSLDVLWILSQWFMGKIIKSWKRDSIPWSWGILNTVLILSIIVLKLYVKDIYSTLGLVLLTALNAIAFVIDVILVDHYLIDRETKEHT